MGPALQFLPALNPLHVAREPTQRITSAAPPRAAGPGPATSARWTPDFVSPGQAIHRGSKDLTTARVLGIQAHMGAFIRYMEVELRRGFPYIVGVWGSLRGQQDPGFGHVLNPDLGGRGQDAQ